MLACRGLRTPTPPFPDPKSAPSKPAGHVGVPDDHGSATSRMKQTRATAVRVSRVTTRSASLPGHTINPAIRLRRHREREANPGPDAGRRADRRRRGAVARWLWRRAFDAVRDTRVLQS